jgi:MFS family permease
MSTATSDTYTRSGVWGMTFYQWGVLLAAWLGWGFDVFDGLLFNYVAPNCVPTLLGLPLGSPEARAATLRWTGVLSSLLLIGMALGGMLFGRLADRMGRTRTLLLTMLIYSLGTALCALAPDIWTLAALRFITSMGIGGEWVAGAAMVAEVVPESRRVEAGALLYTSAPMGLFLATFTNYQVAGVLLADSPHVSWRYVFACGLIPAAVAIVVRLLVKEPERWRGMAGREAPAPMAELFSPGYRARTLSGTWLSFIALLMWWSCNAFSPLVATGLAQLSAQQQGLGESAGRALAESWKAWATNSFNLGGLLGTLLTVPAARHLGRRPMFLIYFLLSAASLLVTFGLELPPQWRLYMYFPLGLSIFGVFGSFTYYLPELFPTRLRGTGSGFCYNAGRIIAAAGPFLVGYIASRGPDTLGSALEAQLWVGAAPLLGLLALPWVVETRGQTLED